MAITGSVSWGYINRHSALKNDWCHYTTTSWLGQSKTLAKEEKSGEVKMKATRKMFTGWPGDWYRVVGDLVTSAKQAYYTNKIMERAENTFQNHQKPFK